MVERIQVDYLARVEGEGALTIKFREGRAQKVELSIFEPPRFFEAFLRGRGYDEPVDITSRICGICPIAYQMSAAQAIEQVFGVKVEGALRDLRRLLYLGEWLESHVLHIFMLHAPDFLGHQDAIQMAAEHPELVLDGLRMKKIGNGLVRAVAGREVHPINARVGGFYRAPREDELRPLLDDLAWGRDTMARIAVQLAGLNFPDLERDYTFVALQHPDEYAICEGRIVSNRGLDIAVEEYEAAFVETHEKRSHALHSQLVAGGHYHVGPLARVNLNFDALGELAKATARKMGFEVPCTNPFRSILARAIETVQAFDEAVQIIEAYRRPERSVVEFDVRAGTGCGATEAPRGMLYHRYRLDPSGTITDAKIVPPTSQNQATIEDDLFDLAPQLVSMSQDEATWVAEQAVRNYDPCISCATHFLRLHIDREG